MTIMEYAVALTSIAAACGYIMRAITRDVVRDVADARKEIAAVHQDLKGQNSSLKHDLKNQMSRIDALEHVRTSDVERIVKLESAVQSFDKAIERVERGQDKLSNTITDRFDILAESIREIRTVAPRP